MSSRIALLTAAAVGAFLFVTNPVVAGAAGQLTGRDIKNNSITGKDVKDRSLGAVDFGSGQLPAGPAGPAGPRGDTGAAGPLLTNLPSGATLTGYFGGSFTADAADRTGSDSISYPFPVAGTVTLKVVNKTGPKPAQCSGTSTAPTALPGYLCVYVGYTFQVSNSGVDGYGIDGYDDYRRGAVLFWRSSSSGAVDVTGSWAVTAP